MTNNTSQKKLGGRPLSYPPELVYGVVERLLHGGMPSARIDAALVKEELCGTYGVKGTIRLDSLQRLVENAISELKQSQDRVLLETLPETVTASLDHFMKGARDVFAIMIAEQNAKCQAEANTQCEELRSDKRSAQWHIADLETENARLQKDIQQLIEERDRSIADAANLRDQLSAGKEEVDRLRGASDLAQLLIDQLQNPDGSAKQQAAMHSVAARQRGEEQPAKGCLEPGQAWHGVGQDE